MSYSWKNQDANSNEPKTGGSHEPKLDASNDEKNKKEIQKYQEDRQEIQKTKSRTSASNVYSNSNKKKRKKTSNFSKEEKEDGELDDENESMEEKRSNEYEEDDYDDYDMDDDSKTSHDDLIKRATTSSIIPVISIANETASASDDTKESSSNLNEASNSLSLPKSTDVIMTHSISSSSSSGSETKVELKKLAPNEITSYASPTASNLAFTEKTIKTTTTPPCTALPPTATHYEMQEEEDYDDDDDDDYCNNKRLKIDESEQLNDETTSKQTQEVSNEMKKDSSNESAKELTSNTEASLNKQLIPDATNSLNTAENSNKQQPQRETQLDLDQDNDSSSSISSKSSSSTSSALTAISTISSDSLPISSTASSITSELKHSNTNETASQEADFKSSSQTTDMNIDDKQAELNDLKVPPLKIIYSNSPGAHPYVKTDEQKLRSKAKEKLNIDSPTKSSKTEDDLKQEIKLEDSPANNSRSKAIKTRVASPITTLPGVTPKTTPTRRSAAHAIHAGRSSPALTFTPPVKTAVQSNAGLAPSGSPLTLPLSATLQATDTFSSTSMSSSTEMENVIRRKLRSHTRQQQTDEPRQLNLTNKSPSPLTILNENTNQNTVSILNDAHDQDSSSSSVKQTSQPNETSQTKSDHSNDSLVDSSDSISNTKEITSNSNIVNTKEEHAYSGRKKRNRQQNNQNENSTTTSESEAQSNTITATPVVVPPVNPTSEQNLAADSTVVSNQSNEFNKEQQNTQQPPQPLAQQQVFNCIKKFLDLRHDLNKKRDDSMEIHQQELPNNYHDFVLFKKNYLIRSNKDIRQSIPSFKPPNDMPDDLKECFLRQEKERTELRVRHRIEQDKLIIFYEQEILRCFNNRLTSQSSMPFSFCSIVKDDEVYSTYGRFGDLHGMAADTQPPDFNPNQTPINPEDKFLQSLESLKNKFQKLKEDLVKRQLNESDSLNAVQKMDFQAHIRELLNKYKQQAKNNPSTCMSNYNLISQYQHTNLVSFVPIVPVSFNKIDLFDVSQIYTTNTIQTSNVQSVVSISS